MAGSVERMYRTNAILRWSLLVLVGLDCLYAIWLFGQIVRDPGQVWFIRVTIGAAIRICIPAIAGVFILLDDWRAPLTFAGFKLFMLVVGLLKYWATVEAGLEGDGVGASLLTLWHLLCAGVAVSYLVQTRWMEHSLTYELEVEISRHAHAKDLIGRKQRPAGRV